MSDESGRPVDLLVHDAKLLVTMDGAEIAGGWVAISDGRVVATGTHGTEPAAQERLSAEGCLVTPGLINTHHHIFQNLTRSFAPAVRCDFLDWWQTLSPMWTRLDEEAVYVSTWIGLAELALSGCTTSSDHLYVHPRPVLIDAEVKAARDFGLRLHAVRGSMDISPDEGGFFSDAFVQDVDTILSDSQRLVETYHERAADAQIRIAFGPCTTFDSTPELRRATAELAERLDVRLHTHLAEVPSEEPFTLEKFGVRPVELFERDGWGSSRAWVAHCIFVNDEEVAQLGQWGTGVCACPSSNALVCVGFAPVVAMRAAGVPVGLGVDGSASTDHASMWLEARGALHLARLTGGPTSMGARDALDMATRGSARCLGREDEIGVLAPGYCGDVAVWPQEGVRFAGAHTDPVEAWLRCGPVSARHTVVGGRVIIRDGAIVAPELEEMLSRHSRISREWQQVSA
jgi:cytosine/adenosine deaminase-related metal-dependent hydrolase